MRRADKSLALALVALFLASLVALPSANVKAESNPDDWPMFHYDPANTGDTNSSAPTSAPTLMWSIGAGGNLLTTPAIVDGVVYVSSYALSAYNTSTGNLLWTAANGGYSAPVVLDGIVYTGAFGGSAFNASTGALVWRVGNNSEVSYFLTVANGYFYSGNSQGLFYAGNASTGTLLWKGAYFDGISYPAFFNGNIYFGTDGSVCALNAYTGAKLWEYKTESSVSASPAVTSGYVYVVSTNGDFFCLDALSGRRIWNYTIGITDTAYSSPAVADGYVYVGSQDGNLYALNASTGEKAWSYTIYSIYHGFGVHSSPAVANGAVYVGADDGNLYAFNAYTGSKLWSYQVQSRLNNYGRPQYMQSSPAIANGTIYIMSIDHFISALGTTPPNKQNNNMLIPIIIAILTVLAAIVSLMLYRRHRKNKRKIELLTVASLLLQTNPQ